MARWRRYIEMMLLSIKSDFLKMVNALRGAASYFPEEHGTI